MEIKLEGAFMPAHQPSDPKFTKVTWALIAAKDGKEGHVQFISSGECNGQFEYVDFVVSLAQLMKSMEMEKSQVFVAARELARQMDMKPKSSTHIEIDIP